MHRNISSWLADNLRRYKQTIDFDGLWLDMNEPSNFDSGAINAPDRGYFNLNYPQYDINNGGKQLPLFHQTVPMDITHDTGLAEYQLHNVYGLSEALAVRKVLEEQFGGQKRMFLLTRSVFPGSGQFTSTWLGDNHSSYSQLKESIWGVLKYGLFGGISMVGPDLCGFNGEANEELCARWMSLGAFFPFSRNHNSLDSQTDQEPFRWNATIRATRKYYSVKYSLLPYWITLFYKNHIDGTPVMRPFDITASPESTQFYVGDSILVCPVVEEGALSVDCDLPAGIWYELLGWNKIVQDKPGQVVLPAPIDHLPVMVKAGSVLAMKQSQVTVLKTLNESPYLMEIFLAAGYDASGWIYIDDNESKQVENAYCKITVSASRTGNLLRIRANGYYGLHVAPTGAMVRSIKVRTPGPLLIKSILQPVNTTIAKSGSKGFELIADGLRIDRPFEIDLLITD